MAAFDLYKFPSIFHSKTENHNFTLTPLNPTHNKTSESVTQPPTLSITPFHCNTKVSTCHQITRDCPDTLQGFSYSRHGICSETSHGQLCGRWLRRHNALHPPRRPVLWWLGGQGIEAPGCGRQNLTVQLCYSHRLLQPRPFPPTSSIFKPRLQ